MKSSKRIIVVALLCVALIFSGTLYAFAVNAGDGVDVTGDEYYLIENEPSTSTGGISIMTSQGFTFSGNIPASPSYVKSSAKTLPAGNAFKVLIGSSTGSKAVKMRLMTSSGTALTSWKSVSVGTTTTLYAGSTTARSVYVQLQSSTTSSMTAQGTWYF